MPENSLPSSYHDEGRVLMRESVGDLGGEGSSR